MLKIIATVLLCASAVATAEEAKVTVPDFGIHDVPAGQLTPTQRLYALKHLLCGDFKADQSMPADKSQFKLWMAQQIACTPPRP